MKKISKKYGSAVLTLIIVLTMLGIDSGAVSAQTERGANAFCSTALPRLSTNLNNRFTQRNERLTSRKANRETKVKEAADNRNSRLAEARVKQDTARTTEYEKLRAIAKDDAQKQAVEKFITAVEEARKIRQQAVDSAIQSYRSSVLATAQSRSSITNDARAKYQTTTSNALTNAKSQCDSGADGATIRNELKTALKTGQEQLKADLKSLSNTQGDYKNARQTLRNATNEATQAFRSAVTAARDELRKSLGTSQ